MTKPRTLEEITYDAWVAVHTPGNLSREVIFAALREAAGAARRVFLERAEQAEAALAAAQKEREMVCYWLYPSPGESVVDAAKRHREAVAAANERAEKLEGALAVSQGVVAKLRDGKPGSSAKHVEQGEGDSCSCGWSSHTKAWRAHAAHMRRRGESIREALRPAAAPEPTPSEPK